MNKLESFYRKYKGVIKTIFVIFIVIITSFVIFKQVKEIDPKDMKTLIKSMDTRNKLFFIIFGLVCFSFSTIYDFILSRYYKMDIPSKSIFKIGWVCQSFNNFIGFGGVAGLTIREMMYDKYKVDKSVVKKILFIVLFSDMIGLFSLGLPSSIELFKTQNYKIVPILFLMFVAVIVFIFIDRFKFTNNLKDEKSIFKRDQKKLRLYITLESTFEWSLAAIFFAFTIRYFEPNISLLKASTVYVIATIVGILSLIPGGLGSFEATCIILFNQLGYGTANIVLSLLICRICYTIIPWVIGLILLIPSTKELSDEMYIKRGNEISNSLSYVVLACGVLIIISAIFPALIVKNRFIYNLLYNQVFLVTKSFSLICGLILIALSTGIRTRVRSAYWLTLITLLTLFSLYLFMEKSLTLSVIYILLISGLISNKEYFDGLTEKVSIKKLLIMSAIVFAITFILIGHYNVKNNINFYNRVDKFSLYYIKHNLANILFFPILIVSIYSILLGVERKYLPFRPITRKDEIKFEEFFKKYPYTLNSHSFYMKDKNIFINSKNTVLFLYRSYKDKIFVLGDPAGDENDFESAIEEINNFAIDRKMEVVFFQITGKHLESFINNNYSFLKLGEDAIVNLKNFSLDGKKFKIMRRSLNSMDKLNLKFKVYNPPFDDVFINRLRIISNEWLEDRREMQFSIGAFKKDYLNKAPIFTIEDDNNIYAFATMFPIKGTKVISIDLMRYVKDGPANLMDMIFLSIINWAKERGYEYFDLGGAPLSNVGNKISSSNKEKMIKLAYKYGNKIYGFQGLRQFKNKYRPEWNSTFLAYRGDYKLPSTLVKLVNVTYGLTDSSDYDISEIKDKERFESRISSNSWQYNWSRIYYIIAK